MDGWMEGKRTGWNCELEQFGEGEDVWLAIAVVIVKYAACIERYVLAANGAERITAIVSFPDLESIKVTYILSRSSRLFFAIRTWLHT